MSNHLARQQWLRRALVWAIAVWAAVMYALMFLHLRADFPRAAPWSDMSKATDEGWYGGGALHHFVFGHWYLPESFNPAVALPMWPLMLCGWFAVAGVGMLQARLLTVLLYGLSLVLMIFLLREEACDWQTCVLAVLLMVANPFCYAFDRLALLEPVSVFWWMLGLSLAGRAGTGGWWRAITVGLAMVALVLTKTTAIALVASILYFLYARAKERGRLQVQRVVVAIATAVVVWCVYFFGWVRPRYLHDFRFLFAINDYRTHLTVLPKTVWQMLVGGMWINAVLFPAGIVVVLAAIFWMRRLWRSPLFVATALAAAADFAVIVYHGSLQPRYFLVLAIPVVMMVSLGTEEFRRAGRGRISQVSRVILLVTAVVMSVETWGYVIHPAYTQRDMARAVAERMRSDGVATPVLMGGCADDISMFTGVKAISFYEPYGLAPLLDRYHPGWMVAWLDWEADFPRKISSKYELQEVARFRVYDDQPYHRVLVLYRMVPRAGVKDVAK